MNPVLWSFTASKGICVASYDYLYKSVRRAAVINEIINLFVCDSDGGGRSGVYLAIDANMELAEEEDAFDVFGYLKKLRQSRRGLIENLVQ